ncbi:Glutathione S-transferase [Candidatus Glomeribacter gigasporarum BEG34]|uniref:Glutathione S-transferase n=1 Tax=Candidatus Glomeribacter gigasporarum BEG34 TaxID=1070319 RepID=G2JBL4_9BURK|nr:glutathione transferase GstA [Candidatus Glomeribacter gigasporarum]CCD30168.1 Glutathione S-transferase [Candidatus Glomeribacter gigasporarum BEG34]
MKLYYSKGACSLAVRILLHEIGVRCEFESVNLKTKQTETGQDFLTINPKGSVPALLLDNQEVLTENAVIQQYLADTYKATGLLPPAPDFRRYRILEWLNFIAADLHKGCGPLMKPALPEEIKENVLRPVLNQKLRYLSQHLGQMAYLCGDPFTLADAYLFVILSWFPALKEKWTDWPVLSKYFSALKARPAIQKALAEEGLS